MFTSPIYCGRRSVLSKNLSTTDHRPRATAPCSPFSVPLNFCGETAQIRPLLGTRLHQQSLLRSGCTSFHSDLYQSTCLQTVRTYTAAMTKSDHIRQFLEKDAEMKPAAIRSALAERGVQVELNHIKVVRHRWRQEQKRKAAMEAKNAERRAKGLNLPVGGRSAKKNQTEVDAEVKRLLDLLDE